MTLAGTPPSPAGDGSSPWGGLSGAALFCGDLLAGVMTAEVTRFLGIMVAEREPTRAELAALTTGSTP